MYGIIRSPRSVLFGPGQRHALPALIKQLVQEPQSARIRVLICTDNRYRADKVLSDMGKAIEAGGMDVHVFEDTIAELPRSCIDDAAKVAARFKADIIVGIGGGSCLDLAKLVALKVTYGGALPDYYGEFKVPGKVLPLIAVPTTAGTGSEVTPVAVLADPDRVMKVGISSPHLIPIAAICDPELTLTCPPSLTAIAGADALTHAIEAFTALARQPTPEISLEHVFIGKNLLSDGFARLAIKALGDNLERAVTDGSDIAARSQVMYGAMAAGQAFGVAGTAVAHAIQYPVGALTHTAHGLGVALLMPYVMEYNRPNCTPELAEMARIFGLSGANDNDLAQKAIDHVDALFRKIGLPHDLKSIGLAADKGDLVAEQSITITRLIKNNPRELKLEGAKAIVNAAFAGDRTQLRNWK
jgi:alcohol dehydrogenase